MKIPHHNWQSCRQLNSSYYRPQNAIKNHCQQYRRDKKIQQASSKSYYNRNKEGSRGMIHSVIHTSEKHKTPIITLENDYYSRKKPPTDSSSTFLRTETRRTKK